MIKKNILVVGASRGIGKSIVELLAQDETNNVIAVSRNGELMKDNFASLSNVTCYKIDLSSSNLKNDLTDVLKGIESLDFMINNAGVLVNKPFPEITSEDFNRCYQVNVIGVMESVQAALPKMNKSHIVNISSIGGFQGSVKFPGLTAYSTSKAALCSFTELFAEEYKDSSIKMNCLCLGAAQTEMLEEAFPGYEAPVSAEKMAEYIVDFTLNAHQWMNGKIIPVSLSTP